MNKRGTTSYSIKPEQLDANQEKVRMYEAEGRRLDGTRPLQGWGELRNENHELKRKLEEAGDVIDDYKRRLHDTQERLTKAIGNEAQCSELVHELTETIARKTAEYNKARTIIAVLAEHIGRLTPGFLEELQAEPEKQLTPQQERHRRYYAEHSAAVRAKQAAYYEANREKINEKRRAKRAAMTEEERAAERTRVREAMRRHREKKKEAQANA